MGLDTVELVMEFEEAFDITIPNRDAEALVTIGDVIRYVQARVEFNESAPCPTARAFYRIRRALVESCGVGRGEVRPESSMESLVPRAGRVDLWERLGLAVGVPLPELQRPESLSRALSAAVLAWFVTLSAALLAAAFGGLGPVDVNLTLAWMVFGVFLGLAAWRLTSPFKIELAPDCRVVGTLARTVAGSLAIGGRGNGVPWNREAVREAVVTIVSEQLGVSRDRLDETTHFVYDLGAD